MRAEKSVRGERFSSGGALKAAHLELEKRSRANPKPDADFLDEIEEFIDRGRATGVLLDSYEDQRTIQGLLDYWATLLSHFHRSVDATLDDYDSKQAPDLSGVECPYQGLESFREQNARFFFGRERIVEDLRKRLQSETFLAVVGSSGSGKSSLVLAGLVPQLVEGKEARWSRALRVVPGSDPLSSLSRTLAGAGTPIGLTAPAIAQELVTNPGVLPVLLDRSGESIVLIVDQFEEAFTICTDPVLRSSLEKSLVAVIRSQGTKHRLILTLRSDYENALTKMPELWHEYGPAKVSPLPLGPMELRDAIEGPAGEVGLRFEDGLVDAICQEVVGESAALPLLQVLLRELWNRKQRNLVTWDEYRSLGGARRALGVIADKFYSQLLDQEQSRVKRVLLRLVRPEAGQEFTSSRITRSALSDSLGNPGWLDETLHRLRDAGLIHVTPGDIPPVDEIEVAHEALVRNWPKLVEWLDTERSRMTEGRRLEARIAEWLRLGAGTAGLLDEESLNEVKSWMKNPDAVLLAHSDQLNRYLEASQAAVDSAREEKEAARRRELELLEKVATEQKHRADEQKRRATWFRRGIVLLSALFLAAVASAWVAVQNSNRADQRSRDYDLERREAQKQTGYAQQQRDEEQYQEGVVTSQNQKLQDLAKNLRSVNLLLAAQKKSAEKDATLERSTRLSNAAVKALPDGGTSLLFSLASVKLIYSSPSNEVEMDQAKAALRSALSQGHMSLPLTRSGATDAAFSPDGLKVLIGFEDGSLGLFEGLHGTPQAQRTKLPSPVEAVAFSPDGGLIAAGTKDGVYLCAADTLGNRRHLGTLNDPVSRIVFSPDSKSLIVAATDHAEIISVSGNSRLPLKDLTERAGSVTAVAFGLGGYWAGTTQGQALNIWDASTGTRLGSFGVPNAPAAGQQDHTFTDLAFGPDGRKVAVGSADGQLRLYDLGALTTPSTGPFPGPAVPSTAYNPAPVFSLAPEELEAIAFSPSGDRIAAAGSDGTIKVWNASLNYDEIMAVKDEVAVHLAFSPDSGRILATTLKGAARLWPLSPNDALADMYLSSYALVSTANGARFAALDSHDVRLWDASTGAEVLRLPQVTSPTALAFGPRGEIAVGTTGGIGTNAGKVDIYSETGKSVRNLINQLGTIGGVALSPDGARLLYSAYSTFGAKPLPSSVGLIDVATGKQLALITAPTGPTGFPSGPLANFTSAAFTPDGSQIVTMNSERIFQIWDAQGKLVRTLPIRASGTIFSVAPDGRAITGIAGNELIFQDLQTGGQARSPAPIATSSATQAGVQSTLFSIAFSRDRSIVLTASSLGIDTWSASTGGHVHNFPLRNANGAVFTADGGIVALTRDGVIHAVPQSTEQLVRAGLSRIDREWRNGECQAIPLPAENCAVLEPPLNDVANANRLALAGGGRAQIVRFLAQGTEADPSWNAFLDPAADADHLISGIATITSRYKADGLAARGETAAARGDTKGAENWFQLAAEAGDRSVQSPAARAASTRMAAIGALSSELSGMARQIAVANESLRSIAAEYLTEANILSPKSGFDAQKEVERIVASDRAAKANSLASTDPETANAIDHEIEASSPGVVSAAEWNQVCWRGSLAAAKAKNRPSAAEVFADACERAVKLLNTPSFRDSRGLNLALQGKSEAAIADFQEYVKANGSSPAGRQRQRWIDALMVNKDPFTPEELATLF